MPPPPDRGRGAASGRAGSSSRPSRAPHLPQSQSSSKSRTSSPATATSQPNPQPNPKPLTTLIPPILPSTPVTLSRPAKAPTYRVQLKTIDLAKPTDKQKFFEITFRELNAPLIRLTTTRTGYYAVTDDVTSIDKLTSKKATTAFEKINLTPIIPPDLRAKRTVFIRQIDADIGLKRAEEIKNETKRQNDWLTGPHRTLAANCPYRKSKIRQKEETEQRQKQEQTHSTYAEIAKHAIQQTNPPQHTLTLTNQTHIKLTALIIEAHIAALDRTKKFGDILTQSLKLNFNIDATFPDRDSTAIFNFYYDRTDSQQPETTQTAPQEEQTIEQTIDTEMDETDTVAYTEIRQKRRISDEMDDSKIIMNDKFTTFVKMYRNYEDSSPIPDNPTKDWFAKELDEDQDNDKGLKLFTQDLDHKPVAEFVRRRKVLFLQSKINIIPHEQFIKFPRYHTLITTTKKSKHTTSEK
ncbi:hypothetical protein FHG87_019976 [Trinorchestia longiramus]|nr:hypothetical protein FHG87_019976 [Trinorchestia longiramus]